MDDVGLVEIKDRIIVKDKKDDVQVDPKEENKEGKVEDEDQEMDDPRDDSKDFMPDQDDWDLKSMPSLTSDEEVHDISYPFDDSVEMMYQAKPVNESEIVTLDTSESSVTDNNPEESMSVSCNCMQDTSRDMIANDDTEDDEDLLVLSDALYLSEV